MPEYDNTNTVVLFKNDTSDNDKKPVLTGTVNVDGVEYEIALWGRTSTRTGDKFWSGNVKPKDAQPVAVGASSDTDDVPF